MRLLNQACKALIQKYSDNPSEYINLMYQHIERCGRTCYRSADKITEDSAKPFVERMIKSNHTAMLEHGTVYLKIPFYTYYEKGDTTKTKTKMVGNYFLNKYSKAVSVSNYKSQEEFADLVLKDEVISWIYATTNLRVIAENNWWDDLQYLCEPTEYHERRITVHFTADAGVMREFFRHRVFSMAQESTRYCNYLRDKFSNSITVIYPSWLKEEEELEFEEDMRVIEELYFKWLKKGWTAQQARVFLPLGVKAEAVMTGFVSDWKHFFRLRCDSAAHPQARELAIPLREEFIKRHYI